MPYFENTSQNRFVVIAHQGMTVTILAGPIGAAGSTRRFALDDLATAARYYQSKMHSLTRRGYQPGRHKPSFIHAIASEPHDEGIRQVYGDWLQDEGDARGELIAIHALQGSRPGDEDLTKRERSLLETHGETLLGRWADSSTIDWHLGFARALAYSATEPWDMAKVLGHIKQLLRHPTCRFLERLCIRPADPELVLREPWYQTCWQGGEEALQRSLEELLVQRNSVPETLSEVVFETPVPISGQPFVANGIFQVVQKH